MSKKAVWLKSAEIDMRRTADYIHEEFGKTVKNNFLRETFRTAALISAFWDMRRESSLLANQIK